MTKMTETELNALLAGITPANEAARAAAHAHWASLAKPLGGLGRLETMLEAECSSAWQARSPGGEPDRAGSDPRRGRKPCNAAHQCVPDGPRGPL